MPDLAESLQGRDLGHLRIIAELWGMELGEQDPRAALLQLTTYLLDPSRVENLLTSLSPAEREVAAEVARHGGRLAWAQFIRLYGEVREMGVARRDRELPHKQPVSAAEALWYRGIIARSFFNSASGPEEYAYIPDDLLALMPPPAGQEAAPLGRPASTAEYVQAHPANDRILDHACTLLAAQRVGMHLEQPFEMPAGETLDPAMLINLLASAELLDEAGMPLPEPVRLFLEAPRGEALAQLARAWRTSTLINELRLLPGLSSEGNWVNDPVLARQVLLDYLSAIPAGTWWSLESLVAAIKKRNPDFQRPAGDYDSWFIRDNSTGEYLRGFEQWEVVEGRLLRYLVSGPLYWLGMLDLASPDASLEVTAFRLSGWWRALINGKAPRGMPVEDTPLVVRSDARLSCRRLVPRRVRYQVARFCEWGKETVDEYQYQISVSSLTRARKQGLSVAQLVALLNRHAKAVPPSLVKALERWDKSGSEARLEKLLILRVTSAEVLKQLRNSPASRYLGEPIGATTIAIKPGAAQKVLGALAELGYLGEIRTSGDDS